MQIQKRKIIGVDIGSTAVKVVQGSKSGRNLKCALAPMPEGVLTGNQINSSKLLSSAVRRALGNARIGHGKAALTLSGNDVIIRQIVLPRMSAENLRQNIIDEISGYLAVNPSLYSIDYKVQEVLTDGGLQYKTMIVAVQKSLISSYVHALKAAGLKVVSVDVSANAKEKLVNMLSRSQENYAIFDLGMNSTAVDAYLGGRYFVGKTSTSGAGMAVTALAEATGTDELKAWDLIQSQGSSAARQQAISDYVDQMLYDAGRVIDYFRSRNSMAPLNRVYLCGGGACIPGVVPMIQERLGLPVQDMAEMLATMLKPRRDLNPMLSTFALAAGATLTEVDG